MKRFWLVGLLALGVACAQPEKKKDTQPAFRALGKQVPADEERSDEAIGMDIRHQISLAGPTDLVGVVVYVNDGVVTLRGSTPTRVASFRAESAALAVKGVKTVINQIQPALPGQNY